MISATTKPRREDLPKDANLCEWCTAKCCHYYALPIDKPDNAKEFDFVRWYMVHGDTTVFCEDDDWYLMVFRTCMHLQPDNRCGIYETRPQICREYSTDNCEYDDDWTYDRYWETPEQIYEYAEAVLPKKKGQSIRSPKPALLPVIA